VRRELVPLVAEIARSVAYEDNEEAISGPDLQDGEPTTAPAIGEWRTLSAPYLADTLELSRSDGHAYLPYRDFFEDAAAGRWENLRIPEGQALTAAYYTDGEPPAPVYRFEGSLVRTRLDLVTNETVVTVEPKTTEPEPWKSVVLQNLWTNEAGRNPAGFYRHEGRVYLRGRLTGGTTTVGTALFALDAGYRPANIESLPGRTNAGPVEIDVSPAGVVSIGDGTAGNTWLSLDGLSFRVVTGYGARYPNTNRYPNVNRYPMGS
jgi:hypothetical protein